MTTTGMKTRYPQSSDWSMPQSGSSYLRDSMIVMSQNKDNFTNHKQDYNINQDKPNSQREKRWRLPNFLTERCTSKAPFLYGLLLGALTSGLILAIVLTLLLTSANKKTSTTTIMNVFSINKNAFVSNTTTSTIISTNPSTTSSTNSTTTSTRTTITTTVNPCGTPVSVGTSSTIYSALSGSSSYSCRYLAWTASTTGSVTLVFQLRNDPDQWYMDDVSISNGTAEMLLNGGFESGSISPGWTTSNPYGGCNVTGSSAQVGNTLCRSGIYCLIDGCGSHADQVSQSFVATAGQVYFVSFWLKQGGGSGSVISVSVTLS